MQRSGFRGLVCAGVCLFLATSVMAPSLVMAQGRGGGRGGFGGGGFTLSTSQLLGSEQVQKELKITDEQKEKLTALRGEGGGRGGRGGAGGGGAGGGRNFQDMTEEEREKAMAEFQKRAEEFRKQAEETNKKVEAILTADQVKRAKEISLQVNGNAANLQNPAIVKELGLSEEQVASVKTIAEETGKQMGELFKPDADRTKMREAFAELNKNADEEYMAVLSDEQKAKLETMKGAKFEFDRATLFPGGRGGPGGGGRGRRGNNTTKDGANT